MKLVAGEVELIGLSSLTVQAGHRAAAGFSHLGYRHQQTKRIPDNSPRASGQPGYGPSAGHTQAFHTSGILPFPLQMYCLKLDIYR